LDNIFDMSYHVITAWTLLMAN